MGESVDDYLASLLVDLSGLSSDQADRLVRDKYTELYLDRGTEPRRLGIHPSHDGMDILFTESRYDHAFRTSRERRSRPYAKDALDRLRGERVAWIGPVVAGEAADTECWMIPPKEYRRDLGHRQDNRLYVVRQECYVIWLEPSGKHASWWFSSAYVAGYGDVRRYCRQGRRMWTHEKSRD